MPSSRFVWLVFVALGLAVLSEAAITRSAGASAPPALNVSAHGTLTNGQTISVSVGSNGYFTPHARVNILECADPGGLAANLPKDDSTCDGNTIQGSTVLVGSDGSFSDPSYPVYLLPSATLGEQGNAQPICDQTHYCVLFVGQNQNDFTVAKVFSAPFLIAAGSGTTPATNSGSPSSTSSGPSAGSTTTTSAAAASLPSSTSSGTSGSAAPSAPAASAAASAADASGALANTGPPVETEWVVLAGLVLLLTGIVGRRYSLRDAR